jgi:hypothetical protein
MNDPTLWAKLLVTEKAWVLHLPTQRIGQVQEFWDGLGNKFVSDLNSQPVQDPVLGISTGDKFIATPDHFTKLTEGEAGFYQAIQILLGNVLGQLGPLVEEGKVGNRMATFLIATALRTQANAISGTSLFPAPLVTEVP